MRSSHCATGPLVVARGAFQGGAHRGAAARAIRSPSIYASLRRSGRNVDRWIGDLMTVDTAHPSVFDAGLPTLDYDLTTTPAQLYPLLLAAQQQAPIALGPFGPEFISYELVRAVLRDSRFQVPPGLNLAAAGITSGPLYDKIVNSILGMEGPTHQRVRGVVSKAFTPRAVERLHATIVDVIDELVEPLSHRGHCDVVTDLARPYPVPIIC